MEKNSDQEAVKKRFFEGMSFAAATVNVITTDGPAGRAGVTVSAMSSVSADTPKPTLLVCINEKSASAETLLSNGTFCVNVLRDHQSYISDAFAGRFKDDLSDKFKCTEWTNGSFGLPHVADGLVAFDCRLVTTKKIGTHHVCFGEVEEVHLGDQGSALIYANRSYGATSRIETPEGFSFESRRDEKRIRIGCFHTFAPFLIPRLIARTAALSSDLSIEIFEGDARRLKESLHSGEVDFAFTYDVDDGDVLASEKLFRLEPYILLAVDHPLSNKSTLAPDDLSAAPMIAVKDPVSRDMLEDVLRSVGITPNVAFTGSSLEMVRGLVGHGLGYAVMMTKPASSLTYDGMQLTARPLSVEPASRSVVLSYYATREHSRSARAVMNLAKEIFAEAP